MLILAPCLNTGQRTLQAGNANDVRLSHFGNSVFNQGQLRRGLPRENAPARHGGSPIRFRREDRRAPAPYFTQSQRVRW
jgi:hypothetical protein